ncbi:hypothetical protein EWM64_g9476 [Hericium alpestre]|uniref:Uncharacterized protein n=1 Tax=Hericium alpestre TaxID=135208 RepID=A0A4Y9ZIR2_9AGAM|nr:hypothetical protein EWM64_g9476 [Hericium alpestre]
MDSSKHAAPLVHTASSVRPETLLVLLTGILETTVDLDTDGILNRFNSGARSLSKGSRPCFSSSTSSPPDADSDPLYVDDRLKSALDAVAILCVMEPQGEVYAVALETRAGKCTLYIACNGTPPALLEAYLNGIRGRLLQISLSTAIDADKSTGVPSNETIQALMQNMLMDCHKHGLKKIRRRLEKRKAGFDAYMAKLSQNPARVDVALRDKLCCLQGHLNVLVRMFEEQEPDDEIAVVIVYHASSLYEYLKEGSAELYLLQELDQEFATTGDGFTMRRFFEKLFAYYTAVMDLVSVTGSVAFWPLIKCNFTVVLVPGEHHVVSFPVRGQAVDAILTTFQETALRHMHDSVEKTAKEPWSGYLDNAFTFQSHVHAVCALISYLHRQQIRTYRYLGISKLACYSCSRYINAYNALSEELDGSQEDFFMRGTRGKIYLPWILPHLGADRDQRIQENMMEEIRWDMEALLGREAMRQARPGSTDISESENASSTFGLCPDIEDRIERKKRKFGL